MINGKIYPGHQPLLVSSEMGLGHLRAIYPFEDYLGARAVIQGQSQYSTPLNRWMWRCALRVYALLSQSHAYPLVGWFLFGLLAWLLRIPPRRMRAAHRRAGLPSRLVEWSIAMGSCRELESFQKHQQVITSFYTAVNYYARHRPWIGVLCQICDADLSRVWVPRNPLAPNIHYLAPCLRAYLRLRAFGVERSMVTLSGFPFPHALVGGVKQERALANYSRRLSRLRDLRRGVRRPEGPLHVVYSIGGTGVLADVGMRAALSLLSYTQRGQLAITLLAPPGSGAIRRLLSFKGEHALANGYVRVIDTQDKTEYFKRFTEAMSCADVLWTKPGELIFYSSLGIPIVMAKPIGPQEVANREHLLEISAGVDQGPPEQADRWLLNLLHSGALERMARSGWVKGIRTGLYTAVGLLETHRPEHSPIEPEYLLQE